MRRGVARVAAGMAFAALLAGCALAPPAGGPVAGADGAQTPAPGPDLAFDVSGRLSARRGGEGVSAGYRWQHEPHRDEVLFTTPLGAAAAELRGDANGARIAFADGKVREAADLEALTEQAMGAPVPLRGLAWWIRARPRPGSAFSHEPDGEGRLGVLHQDGWQIVFAYAEGAAVPRRLVLSRDDVEVRLSIDPAP